MLNPDYAEILSLFNDHDVQYVLVGAYAMAVHGFPRATADIDIFVKPASDNARRVYEALREFGAPLESVNVDDFATPGVILQIGVAPRRIDILTQIDGLTFDQVVADQQVVTIDELSVPVISKQNLIRNKLASGRRKDALDAESLQDH